MGQTGFASKPGGQSLVQLQADADPGAAGKQTRVGAAEAAGDAKVKQHAGGGFSKYGGPSVREYLTRMAEQGQLQITGKQIALLDAVAQVETGGKIGCVQTYDDQIVSVGFKQVVLGHGSLEKIMRKAPAGFAKHGLELDPSKKYTHPGWSKQPSQIAGCEDENELRKPEWGLKFYDASMEPDVVAAMCELALGESAKVEKAAAKLGGGADLFSDPTAQGWLLETYNNRPAFMPIAIKKAVEGGAKTAASRDAFLDILAKAIVDTYVEQEPLLHYRKAKAKKKSKLTAEQDAALLEDSKKTYAAIGRRKGTNITTKIKRNLVVPKLDGDQAGPPGAPQAQPQAQAQAQPQAPAESGPAEAPAPAPISTPADEVLMSMPAPEPEAMSVPPEPEAELMCLPGDAPAAESHAADAAGAAPPAPAPAPAAAEQEPDWSVRARAYNREHAAYGEQFLKATGGACVGPDGELDPAEIARWQVAHDLKPDGRVGPQTVKTAQAKAAAPAEAPAQAEDGGEGGGSAPAKAEDGGGSGGAAGDHDELPVPAHADDVTTPETVDKKPPSAPAKPAGKEVYQKGGILSKEHLGRYDLSQQEYEFKLRVYDAAVARLGDKIYGGVPKEELVKIENGKQLRSDVAGPLNSMLAAMRADLAAGKAAGDKEVGKATGIHVTSAYRSPETDRDLWDRYFQKYLAKTAADREATGDPFGSEALKLLVKYIASRKAPPGGSNHSNGTAVDLTIEEGGKWISNSYDNQSAWKKSWHYAWLNANAATYGFKNYPKEAWHWDYKG